MRDLRFFAPRRPLEPGEDGRVWAYYYIEDISSPTQIIYATGGVGSTLIVDGVSVPRNGSTYQFTSTGMHLIRYNMACTGKNFLSISTVKEIYIPNSVTSLPYQFIDNAHNLEKLVAPSVTTLNASGIGIRNTNIHEVILPSVTNFVEALGGAQTYLELESVVQIGPDAANRPTVFAGASNMQTVILGPNCQTLGSRLFQSVNWIPTIVIKATTPPTVMYGAMSNMGSNVKFYVPYSADHSVLNAYKNTTPWDTYASQIYELCANEEIPIIFADAAVETICVNNFGTDIAHFPRKDAETVTSSQLGTTFQGNTQITSFDELQYFTNVRELYNNAFSGCSSLTSIVLPNSLTTVGSAVFNGCTSLTHVVVPPSVTSINLNTFNQSGDGTGTIDIQCEISIDTNKNPGITLNYANVVFSDIVYNNSIGYPLINASPDIVTLKLKSWNSNRYLYYSGSSAYSQIMFVEIEETFSGTLWYTVGQNGVRAVGDGCIIHLAYNGVAGTSSDIGAQMGRIAKIYVGDGTSQASDQAILDLYLADTDWAQYASKLDLWYNYSGTYKQ